MQQEPIMQQNNTMLWFVGIATVVILAALGWYFFAPHGAAEPVMLEQISRPLPEPAPEPAETIVIEKTGPAGDPLWIARIAELGEVPLRATAEQGAEAKESLIDLLRPLERGPSLGRLGADGGAYALVSQTAIALAKQRPIASGEVDSYRMILSNLSHLTRVLGKKRTLGLRQILDAQGESLEPLAAAAYHWLVTRESQGEGAEQEINLLTLYDYASFMLNTMGGHSYLQRRLPRQEALANFYSLLIVDRARKRKISGHGTDLRPHFARTRQLLETQDLVYREQYLAVLDDIEASWR